MRLRALKECLALIEQRWTAETDPLMLRCLAKLYCLEACGWIESWIDDFIAVMGDRRIGCDSHRQILSKHIKRTYGFEYDYHVRPLLVSVSGLKSVCVTEAEIDVAAFTKMKAALANLKEWRDKHAHTDSVGVLTIVVAPSACRAELDSAIRGLYLLRRTFRRSS